MQVLSNQTFSTPADVQIIAKVTLEYSALPFLQAEIN